MDEFTRKHAAQLVSAGIPEELHGELRRKLEDEVFDAGDTYFIALVDTADSDSDEGEPSTKTNRASAGTTATSRKVVVRDDYVHDGGEEIFLVDHAWTFQAGSAREHLTSSQPLLQRMAALMQLPLASKVEEATAAVTGGDHPAGVPEIDYAEESSGGGSEGREAQIVGGCPGGDGGLLEGVLSALPTFSRRYSLGSAGRYACFVNDELGSAFRHSETPNCQMAPILFSGPSGVMAFSVLWPLRRLLPSEEATVDLLWSTAWAGASVAARGCFVQALGLPQSDLPHRLPEDCQSAILPRNCLAKRQRLMDFWAREKCTREAIIPPPDPAPAPMASGNTAPAASREIPDSGENNDTLGAGVDTPLPGPPGGFHSPQVGVAPSASGASARVGRDNENPLTVWTDLPYLCDSVTGLTRPEFRVLESGASPRGADVLWASRSIDQNFEVAMGGLMEEQLVSQFPYEAALVIKSHLARTIQREFGSSSPEGDMMQPTFDLQSEHDALAFIAEFRRRCHDGLDNIWIVKPIGLARSMDTTVTGALAGVLRAADTGPKVAQLYISRPLLWKCRKFDLRIVALLVSSHPLELYVHNCYWPRVAKRAHETEREASLEDPRVSLTATHLVGETAVGEACHPHYEDFARYMQGLVSERHPGSTWEGVLVKTRSIIASVFRAAARQQPGMACPRARAMYGCDVMVTEDLEPRLLEVTFSPANLAASPAWPVLQPEFLNEAFGCLFLGEQKNVTRLS